MLKNIEFDVAKIGVRLLDDAYLAWFSAESDSETALRAWFHSTGERRESTYFSYLAALDREDAAARDLERLWRLAEPCRETLAMPAERASE
jgi:hypothetical protein